MNCLLLNPEDLTAPGRARITGRRFQQLKTVIRAEVGKRCKVGLRDGCLGFGTICSMGPDSAELEFVCDVPPPPPSPISLIIALPRPKSFTKVLHAAVEQGVKRIWFISSFKVEKSYWNAPRLMQDAVEEEVTLALEQCCDPVSPRIEFRRAFKPFLEDEVPGLLVGTDAFLGDPAGTEPVPSKVSRPTILAIGPEGGFTDYENGKFREAGFRSVSLGARVLRSEFAAAALLGRMNPDC